MLTQTDMCSPTMEVILACIAQVRELFAYSQRIGIKLHVKQTY